MKIKAFQKLIHVLQQCVELGPILIVLRIILSPNIT